MIADLVREARTVRRFDESRPVERTDLRRLVDAARLSPCGGNRQPLRYRLVSGAECASVFPHLAWAAALRNWGGPAPGQRPTGYVIILGPGPCGVDTGVAAQTIQLAAREMGYGACMLGAIQREAIHAALAIPATLQVQLVVALGRPAETVVMDEVAEGAPLAYYRDAGDAHHVPKLRLADVIVGPA